MTCAFVLLIAFVVLVRFIGFLLFLYEQIKCMYVCVTEDGSLYACHKTAVVGLYTNGLHQPAAKWYITESAGEDVLEITMTISTLSATRWLN